MRMKKLFKKGVSLVLTAAMVMSVVSVNGVANVKAAGAADEVQAETLGFDYYKEIAEDSNDKTNAICRWGNLTKNSANTQDVVYGLDGTKKVAKVYLGRAKDGTKLQWYIAGHDHVGHIDNSNVEIKPDQTYLLLSAQQLGTSSYNSSWVYDITYPNSTLCKTLESYCYSDYTEKKGTSLFSEVDDSVITALPLADNDEYAGTKGKEVKLYAPDVDIDDNYKAYFVLGYTHNSSDVSKPYIPVQEQYVTGLAQTNNGYWLRKRDVGDNGATYNSWAVGSDGYGIGQIVYKHGVVAACNIDFSKINHMSLVPALQEGVYTSTGDKGQKFDDAMTLRVNGYDQIKSRAEYTKDTISVYKSAQDEDLYLCVQGENQKKSDGSATLDYGYSIKIDKTQDINLDTIKEAVGSNIDLDASSCKIWLEKAADEKSSTVYAVNAEQKSNDTAISEVDVTVPVPKKGETIAQNVSKPSSNTTGVIVKTDSGNAADKYVTYYKEGEEVFGEKKVIAGVTYTAKANFYAESGYVLSPSISAENVKVNGNPATDVIRNKDGSITVSYDFSYKADLVSAVLPTVENEVANGTGKTVEALKLPTKTKITVTKETDEDSGEGAADATEEKEAEITWDLEKLAEGTYDPEVTKEQTFKVNGTVVLPEEIDNPNNVPLTLTASITVKEKEKTVISSVAITDVDSIKPTLALDKEAATKTEGVTLSAVTYTVKDSEEAVTETAKFNTTYVASITITAKEGYKFGTAIAEKDVTINGNEVTSLTRNEDGTITVTSETTTPMAALIKIITPDDITVEYGAPKTAEGLGLPATVTIETEDAAVTSAKVNWTYLGKYNPKKTTKQAFQVQGEVILPDNISNANNVFRYVKPTVIVLAKGDKLPNTDPDTPSGDAKPDTPSGDAKPDTPSGDAKPGDSTGEGTTDTKKAVLVSITKPKDIANVVNGTAKTTTALGLPRTVQIKVKNSDVTSAPVIWDLQNLAEGTTYDQKNTNAQTFKVNGKVILPLGVENTENIPLTITIQVSVLAKATTNKTNQKTDQNAKKNDSKTNQNTNKTEQKTNQTTTKKLKNGDIITDKKTNATYKFANGALVYAGSKNANAATVTIPATYKRNGVTYKVTAIADNAFNGCKKLKTIKIGKNCTSIGKNAFKGCVALKEITIPASVTKIGKSAFEKCKNLKKVTFLTTKLKSKSVGNNAFKGTAKNVKVTVPKKSSKAYKKFLKKKGFHKKAKYVAK